MHLHKEKQKRYFSLKREGLREHDLDLLRAESKSKEQKTKNIKTDFFIFSEIPWFNKRRIAKLAATITQTRPCQQ
jgi:hypothetical protein